MSPSWRVQLNGRRNHLEGVGDVGDGDVNRCRSWLMKVSFICYKSIDIANRK